MGQLGREERGREKEGGQLHQSHPSADSVVLQLLAPLFFVRMFKVRHPHLTVHTAICVHCSSVPIGWSESETLFVERYKQSLVVVIEENDGPFSTERTIRSILSKQWKKEQANHYCTADVCLRQPVNQLYNNNKMAQLVLASTAWFFHNHLALGKHPKTRYTSDRILLVPSVFIVTWHSIK